MSLDRDEQPVYPEVDRLADEAGWEGGKLRSLVLGFGWCSIMGPFGTKWGLCYSWCMDEGQLVGAAGSTSGVGEASIPALWGSVVGLLPT
jgi:hypothetical protein